jgi:hypothetical protein
MVEIVDLNRHAEIVRGYHFLTGFPLIAHMNFGSTLVHNASVDFINLLCGTSAL